MDDCGLVYVSIPKVACTSIQSAIGVCRDGVSRREVVRTLTLPRRARSYFKFAFVRNPFDRLVSCYTDKVLGANKQRAERAHFDSRYNRWLVRGLFGDQFAASMTFRAFVELVGRIPDFLADSHFKSQYAHLAKASGHVDYVGMFESLDEDWRELQSLYDLGSLKRLNVGKHQPWSDYYRDPAVIEAVRRRYRRDIDMFGYEAGYQRLIGST